MNWLNDLKIAIVEKDIDRIEVLMGTMPEFEHVEDMKSASALLEESMVIVQGERSELSKKMIELKKSKKFLQADIKQNALNIQS